MDDVLERILSLIPRKDNGDFLYGSKKQFCDSIGITSQNLSDWIAGRSQKYMDKLYEISAVYNVPVRWLKTGEDIPDEFVEYATNAFEEMDALQILRDNPATRTLLKAGKNLTKDQIDNFAKLMESISGENNAN